MAYSQRLCPSPSLWDRPEKPGDMGRSSHAVLRRKVLKASILLASSVPIRFPLEVGRIFSPPPVDAVYLSQ